MPQSRISIALATYNGARYLQEQLDSLAAQRRPPDELVICDDASRDATMEIVERFRASAPFEVRVYRNETNRGYSASFEAALSRCVGDIIFVCDQDDVWFGGKIDTVARVFAEQPTTMVVSHDNIITDHDLTHAGVTTLQNIRSLGLDVFDLRSGCCTALRRGWLDLVLPIPHAIAVYDQWISQLADLLGARWVLSQPLLYYRRHGANVSRWMASTPSRVSSLTILRRYGLGDVRRSWGQQADGYRALIERLRDRTAPVDRLGLSVMAAKSIVALQEDIEAIEARTRLVSMPRWSRTPYVLRFLAAGRYRHFAGWKSAVKDMIRP